jgi:hypothetical protein
MRDRHLGSTQYPYYGILRCPICGEAMIRYCLPTHGFKAAWTCGDKNRDEECAKFVIKEEYIDNAVKDSYNKIELAYLENLADSKDISISNSARIALEWKMQHSSLMKIDYCFLDDLISEISINPSGEIKIAWKFGHHKEVQINFRKAFDIPNFLDRGDRNFMDDDTTIRGKHYSKSVERIQLSSRSIDIGEYESQHRPRIHTQNLVAGK